MSYIATRPSLREPVRFSRRPRPAPPLPPGA
jgi:hypothetical protein